MEGCVVARLSLRRRLFLQDRSCARFSTAVFRTPCNGYARQSPGPVLLRNTRAARSPRAKAGVHPAMPTRATPSACPSPHTSGQTLPQPYPSHHTLQPPAPSGHLHKISTYQPIAPSAGPTESPTPSPPSRKPARAGPPGRPRRTAPCRLSVNPAPERCAASTCDARTDDRSSIEGPAGRSVAGADPANEGRPALPASIPRRPVRICCVSPPANPFGGASSRTPARSAGATRTAHRVCMRLSASALTR